MRSLPLLAAVAGCALLGVPVVATTLLAEQLGWRDGEELLCAASGDPSGFAEKLSRCIAHRSMA